MAKKKVTKKTAKKVSTLSERIAEKALGEAMGERALPDDPTHPLRQLPDMMGEWTGRRQRSDWRRMYASSRLYDILEAVDESDDGESVALTAEQKGKVMDAIRFELRHLMRACNLTTDKVSELAATIYQHSVWNLHSRETRVMKKAKED